MITEDRISFETAKLLKEKGFDLPVHYVYHYWANAPFFHRKIKNFNGEEYRHLKNEWYSAPTQSLAMKWLREVHNLEIYPYHQFSEKGDKWWFEIVKFPSPVSDYESNAIYATYEEAAEAGIKYCLENLI